MSTARAEPVSDAERVILAAVMDAAQYADDSVALGVLMMTCRLAGYPLEKADAKKMIEAARKRPKLRIVR